MKVSRKLFLAIASFIVAMSAVYILLTYLVVKESVEVAVEATRGEEIRALAVPLTRYYNNNNDSWKGIQNIDLSEVQWSRTDQASFLLSSHMDTVLLKRGSENDERLIRRLGIKKPLQLNGETIGVLYFYDPEVAFLSKLRIGIPISVLFLLIISAVLFVAISLLIAYWLSKRLTAPLRQLIPFIRRVGNGEFGIQAPVTSRDEYAIVTEAFNDMSQTIEQAETNRRNLVADVAHELRTPITIIRGRFDLLQHSGRTVETESLLPLQDELIRLTRLVDDLHQLSLAEANKLPIERKETSLHRLLQRILDRVMPDANQKCIQVSLSYDSELPNIYADPTRITQVFLNLIMNAIRYTTNGGSIEISVYEEEIQDQREAVVSITDNGPGIEPEHLPHLFDRFYRTDESRTRYSGGMGLGLAIAKGYVTAHHGSIDVESNVGKGTTFIVRLPLV